LLHEAKVVIWRVALSTNSKAEDGVDEDKSFPSGLAPLGELQPFPAYENSQLFGDKQM
jgi:hypothetical protein